MIHSVESDSQVVPINNGYFFDRIFLACRVHVRMVGWGVKNRKSFNWKHQMNSQNKINYAEFILSQLASNGWFKLYKRHWIIFFTVIKSFFSSNKFVFIVYIKIHIFQLILRKKTILSSSKTFNNNFMFISYHFTILKP